MSSPKRSTVPQTAITAFSAGGFSAATCSALNAPQLLPIIPTAPLHQGCAAAQAITAQASASSCGVYSSVSSPSLSPDPRRSTRRQA